MRRRSVLQVGVAWALLPVAGCGEALPPSTPREPVREPSARAEPSTPLSAEAPASSDAPSSAVSVEAPAQPPPSPFSRVVARLGKNHGHVLTLPLADVTAGVERTYDIRGSSSHAHAVTVTAAHMKSLLEGRLVRTKSTVANHAHQVVVRCAPDVDPPEWVSVCTFHSSGADEHELIVTAADFEAKVEKTYDIQGLAGHAHQVTLTAAHFAKLAAGGPVTVHSTRDPDDAHEHTVSIERARKAKA